MEASSPSLLDVQRALRASLADGRQGVASYVLADGLDAAARLSIYRETATGTLVGALRLTFPAVRKLVGEEFFEGAARAFIDQQPARSAWLDEYGAGFASFIARFPPAAIVRYLPDVAELEWAVSRALHAPEAVAIDPARLGILGGSYGGYMTSWAVGHTDRFKAACSERACNNLTTMEHSADIAGFLS